MDYLNIFSISVALISMLNILLAVFPFAENDRCTLAAKNFRRVATTFFRRKKKENPESR